MSRFLTVFLKICGRQCTNFSYSDRRIISLILFYLKGYLWTWSKLGISDTVNTVVKIPRLQTVI